MAATCLDIITYAMRQTKVLGPGKEPKGAEAEEGMVALQSFYDEMVANAMFGRLEDSYLTADDTAEEGKRYLLDTGVTLTEPTVIAAEDSADGVARQPRDLSLYEVVDSAGARSVRLYDRSAWVDLIDLELSDIAPLSGRGAYGLAAALATSGGFIDMFGAEPSPAVLARATRFLSNVSHKLGSTRDRATPDFF
jgi:hypothetical protein